MGIKRAKGRICVVPRVSGVGGMVSFRDKFVDGLRERDFEVSFSLSDVPYDAVLVIGGTRDIPALWQARRSGVKIVQRLDGMNWLHRFPGRFGLPKDGVFHFIRAEYGNYLLRLVRARLATHVVYQSKFVLRWWERRYGKTEVAHKVIYNGVDLSMFSPQGSGSPPQDYWRLLLVEGNLMGGYESGLAVAFELAKNLASTSSDLPLELMVAGRVAESEKRRWLQCADSPGLRERLRLNFVGQVPSSEIPALDRSAHVLYAADINSACPNSVIEALACGLPVAAFDTGALPELVGDGAGEIVPYGGNPWKLDPPDVSALASAAAAIFANQPIYRKAARQRAENMFDLNAMIDEYLEILLG